MTGIGYFIDGNGKIDIDKVIDDYKKFIDKEDSIHFLRSPCFQSFYRTYSSFSENTIMYFSLFDVIDEQRLDEIISLLNSTGEISVEILFKYKVKIKYNWNEERQNLSVLFKIKNNKFLTNQAKIAVYQLIGIILRLTDRDVKTKPQETPITSWDDIATMSNKIGGNHNLTQYISLTGEDVKKIVDTELCNKIFVSGNRMLSTPSDWYFRSDDEVFYPEKRNLNSLLIFLLRNGDKNVSSNSKSSSV